MYVAELKPDLAIRWMVVSISGSLTTSGYTASIRSLVSTATATTTAGTDSTQAALSRTTTVHVPSLWATRASTLLTSGASTWSTASITTEITATHTTTRFAGAAHPGLLLLHIQLLTVRRVVREVQGRIR